MSQKRYTVSYNVQTLKVKPKRVSRIFKDKVETTKEGSKVKFQDVPRTTVFSNIYTIHKALNVTKENRENVIFSTSCIERLETKTYGSRGTKTPTVGTWVITRLSKTSETIEKVTQALIKRFEEELKTLTEA